MSRTTRKIPSWVQKVIKSNNDYIDHRGSFDDAWIAKSTRYWSRAGRDGAFKKDLHIARNDSPKGYDTWDSAPSGAGSRRSVKRDAAHVNRHVFAKRDIAEGLNECILIGEEFQEAMAALEFDDSIYDMFCDDDSSDYEWEENDFDDFDDEPITDFEPWVDDYCGNPYAEYY